MYIWFKHISGQHFGVINFFYITIIDYKITRNTQASSKQEINNKNMKGSETNSTKRVIDIDPTEWYTTRWINKEGREKRNHVIGGNWP